MRARVRIAPFGLLVALAVSASAQTLSGGVYSETGEPVSHAFVGALDTDYAMAGYAITDSDGRFSIAVGTRVEAVAVQPPGRPHPSGLDVYSHQPRVYTQLTGEPLDIRLPEVGNLVLEGRNADGALMRWEDYEALGQFGGVFMYATDRQDVMLPAVPWPVHDRESKDAGAPRERGLPALTVPLGETCVAQILFWETTGYGKLLLRADNGGDGFRINQAGQTVVIDVNVELARTAVSDLERRHEVFHPLARLDIALLRHRMDEISAFEAPIERAAAADQLLVDALALRDVLERERAREVAEKIRKGNGRALVRDQYGEPVPGATVIIEQQTHDFLFGVFEGSPFNAEAFQTARDAGFNLATVLPAWGWTDLLALDGVDRTLGVSRLNAMGYKVKAHGMVWMQDYGILPEDARTMRPETLREVALGFARALVASWRNSIAIWEVINEPATTNVVGLSRDAMVQLMADAAAAVTDAHRRALVNSPHEANYGRKFLFFGPDNRPVDEYSMTYSTFLNETERQDALVDVDLIGLQFYPGARLDETVFGGHQAPAQTFGWLVDTLERYAAFGKPIHITEFSLPSMYGEDWHAGYWRAPWTPALQADYAEGVFELAFGTEAVESITWWDITDAKPSVVSGGLIGSEGPKPAFERIARLISEWTTRRSVVTNELGEAKFEGYGGHYRAEAVLPDGNQMAASFHLPAGATITLTFEPES